MPTPWGTPTFEDRGRANRQRQLQYADDLYQARIRTENIKNLELQNAALSSSIRAMGGSVPGQSVEIFTGAQSAGPTWAEQMARFPTAPPTVQAAPAPSRVDISAGGDFSSRVDTSAGGDFPSLAEIRSMIESSQQKAEEDFTSKINLLQNQERQKQEEDQLNARNAASRMQSYQQQSAIGAWESALRGR